MFGLPLALTAKRIPVNPSQYFQRPSPIRSLEKNLLTVEQDEEICGQKEPKVFEFKSPKELEAFVHSENTIEADIVRQLEGNNMPYR